MTEIKGELDSGIVLVLLQGESKSIGVFYAGLLRTWQAFSLNLSFLLYIIKIHRMCQQGKRVT